MVAFRGQRSGAPQEGGGGDFIPRNPSPAGTLPILSLSPQPQVCETEKKNRVDSKGQWVGGTPDSVCGYRWGSPAQSQGFLRKP